MNDREMHLARRLFEIGAVKFGAFKLKLHETKPDAPLSPIYLNVRTKDNPKPGPLAETELDMIGGVLHEVIRCRMEDSFEAMAPVPNAGDPIANAINAKLRIPVPIIRLRKGERDGERHVTGIADRANFEGKSVLIVDDLITAADSKLEAIRAVEDGGYDVYDVLVLVDREQGGREQLESLGFGLYAAFTLTGLLDYYVAAKLIEASKQEEVLAYIAANQMTA